MERLTRKAVLGDTGLDVPPIVFGTSCLGNLYRALADETRLGIVREWFARVAPPVAADSAGKYGAGLALEVMGRMLRRLGVPSSDVVISNKLGWLRTPLRTPEPTFEPGAWAGLEHDAEQRISYDGILECWRQGCELVGSEYRPQLASVHDPDEYLAQATSPDDRARRMDDVLGAYRALGELKRDGQVKGVGVGSKDWRVIRDLSERVELDWVMLACSLTIMHHSPEVLRFVEALTERGVGIINSAVFHAGFLTGGEYFDYRRIQPDNDEDRTRFRWRETFFELCKRHAVSPAEACVRFGMSPPGVVSVSLNTSKPERIRENVAAVQAEIPGAFWSAMKDADLIDRAYPYVG